VNVDTPPPPSSPPTISTPATALPAPPTTTPTGRVDGAHLLELCLLSLCVAV
jgi:hypothetical protein